MAALAEIFKSTDSFKKRKRVARGIASGKGKTAGRGHKGQKSRSGVSIKGFEGGQMPIHRRLPKRGFNNIFAEPVEVVNLAKIQDFIDRKKIDIAKPLTVRVLVESGCVRKSTTILKVLGAGELKSKISLSISNVSQSARKKIEKLGGQVLESQGD